MKNGKCDESAKVGALFFLPSVIVLTLYTLSLQLSAFLNHRGTATQRYTAALQKLTIGNATKISPPHAADSSFVGMTTSNLTPYTFSLKP
jgi:hypothetical protein